MIVRGGLAYLTAEEVGAADRTAIEEFGIPVRDLMERAGAGTAEVARGMLGHAQGKRAVVLVGKGNNGGDGLVAARHLRSLNFEVWAVIGRRSELREEPTRQLRAAELAGMKSEERWASAPEKPDLVIDALLGYNSSGDPREPAAGMIRRANESGAPILAVDMPSGMDATTGTTYDPCVRAAATVTFGWPKTGFLNPEAKGFLGDVYVADIGIPSEVYVRYGGMAPPFNSGPIARVW